MMHMKKTILVTSLTAMMGVATSADAAFTTMADGSYQMVITGGCYSLDNCQTSGQGVLTDNTTADQATSAGFAIDPNPPYGSGIVGDGLMGVINFFLSDGNISVESFSQDSYLDIAGSFGGNAFYIRAADLSNMGGSIDNAGNMNFDPTGRTAMNASLSLSIGEQEWNRDDSTQASGIGTGLYEQWTTGTSTNRAMGTTPSTFDMTGSALLDTGIVGEWTGTLVSAGNYGQAWGPAYDGLKYSEVFNIAITSTVPVPAAVWLFGSGLIGLIGIARRKAHA